jgi:hypothetical protein
MKQLQKKCSIDRLLKKHWASCLFVIVILYLLLEIQRTKEVQTTLKQDLVSFLQNHVVNGANRDYSSLSNSDDQNQSREKMDWHDYKFMEYEANRTGLGEQGKEAVLTKVDGILKNATYHADGYNGYLSDQISLNRSLPDTRHPK